MESNHIALVAIAMPDMQDQQQYLKWTAFSSEVFRIDGIKDPSRKLAENVWLFDLRHDAGRFSQLVAAADKFPLPYTIRFFSSAPTIFNAGKSAANSSI